MALHLPPDSTLDDIPLHDIQQTLETRGVKPNATNETTTLDTKRWTEDKDWYQLDQVASLIDNGFATRDKTTPSLVRMTETGEALRHAVLRDRVPLEKADNVFNTLKHTVEAMKKEGIVQADEVWIYGSYMRRDAAVGDIDIAITTSDTIPIQDRAKAIAQKHGDSAWYAAAKRKNNGVVTGQDYAETMLFGSKRHPLLEDAQTSLYTLSSMPAQCQRVYTDQGGWVSEPPLDKHPSAPDRDPPNRKPKASVTIDQGTFTNTNRTALPTREDGIRAKTRAAAQQHAPKQRPPQPTKDAER